jgi:hypothetical protein
MSLDLKKMSLVEEKRQKAIELLTNSNIIDFVLIAAVEEIVEAGNAKAHIQHINTGSYQAVGLMETLKKYVC